jgi:LmbE family N-acetylglucosaminyl deacetylase
VEKKYPSIKKNLLERLCAVSNSTCSSLSAVIIVAHPDDETIGAGTRLRNLQEPTLIHITDGAPRHMRDAMSAGFTKREDYARARRSELYAALDLAGINPEQAIGLGIVDQEASFNLIELVHTIAEILRHIQPDMVLTHPYEGGHPDHDATAFAAHSACTLLQNNGVRAPEIIEMTSYHIRNGTMTVFEFIPYNGCDISTAVLSDGERELKRRMLDCFATQRETLRAFPTEVERFRPAPRYNFTRPPHEGLLFYEYSDWGMTGTRWRNLAKEALDVLGIEGLT